MSELAIVDVVATLLCLVKHVERTDHAWVHVDELCSEVEVTLQVACVDDVYNDIRGLLYELLAHIKLFWRIGRERVGAGRHIYDATLLHGCIVELLVRDVVLTFGRLYIGCCACLCCFAVFQLLGLFF